MASSRVRDCSCDGCAETLLGLSYGRLLDQLRIEDACSYSKMAQLGVEDMVTINLQFNIAICKLCDNAVRPHGIDSHYRGHKVRGHVLQDIKSYLSCLELQDPVTSELPTDGSAPVEHLQVLRGFKCTQCRYLTIASNNARQHWRLAGHQSDEEEGQRWKEAHLQAWLWSQPKVLRYWIVNDSNYFDDDDLEEQHDGSLARRIADAEAEMAAEDAQRLRRGDAKEDIDRDSPWVKRAGWVKHFGTRDKLEIFEAAAQIHARGSKKRSVEEEGEEAARENAKMLRLYASFDREVERCCFRLDGVPTETLQWLASISSTVPCGVPFGRKGKEASMAKYRSVGQRYLGLCLQAFRAGREDALDRWAISFTDEQWSLLGDIVFELDGEVSNSNDSGFYDESDQSDEEEEEEDEEDGATASESTLDRAVFVFLVSSIRQQVGGKIYASPLLAFCAALGIAKRPLGYLEAHLYTGMLAAVMWWMRLIMLEATFEGQSHDADEVGVEKVLEFREEHAKWLCLGTHTVMSTVIGWMAYGKGWRKRQAGQPTIRWEESNQALFHSGERIAVEDFKRTFRDLVDEAEGLLNRLMEGSWASTGQKLDLRRIDDNMVRLGAGQSFANNPKNTWLKPGPGKVMRLAGSALWDGRRNRWKLTAAKKRLRWLRQFREALMVLVHVWGGQPGRGPEVTTLRHCDSWQLMRNVFILDGQVMIVSDRDKMKAIRDQGRKVARFMPERVGRMVVAYIAWLLPFERMVCRQCKLPEPQEDLLEFMWRDSRPRVWDTEKLSGAMTRVTQAGMGVRVGVARYRPIAIEMGRRIRGLVMQQLESQMEDDEDDDDNVDVDPVTGEPVDCRGSWNVIWDLQSTHGTRIARQHYAVQIGYPGRLQPEMIASFREISRLWHQFLEHEAAGAGQKRRGQATSTERPAKKVRAKAAIPEAELLGGLRRLLGPDAAWRSDKQAESMRTIMGLRKGQSAISVLPTGAGKSILFMLPAILAEGGTSIVVVPFVRLMDDLSVRARAMGVDCVQFQTSMSAGRDGMRRAARLVVVSADIVTCTELTAYTDGLRVTGLLRRIFVDECHTIITDVSYRRKLYELKSLHRYRCPLVLLTATMPVAFESWFRREMLVPTAVMIRDRTTKLNCRYTVEQVKPGKGSVQNNVINTVARISEAMTGRQKGVVYCRSKKRCEAVAAELGCGFHHSDMTEQARREAMDEWVVLGKHRWIVATSGLGTGIDIGGIVAVVHMEQPYGLVDFIQQTGRGARRAGEVVESIMIHDGRPGWEDEHDGFIEKANSAQIRAFMQTTECRRAVVGAFMDGVTGESCEGIPGAELCDNCQEAREASDTEAEEGGVWTRECREEGGRVKLLRQWLDEVADECATCHVRRYRRRREAQLPSSQLPSSQLPSSQLPSSQLPSSQLPSSQLPSSQLPPGQLPSSQIAPRQLQHRQEGGWCKNINGIKYGEARKRVKFGVLACCYKCKLPLDWCEETGEERDRCAYMDKVLPVVFMALRCSWASQLIKEEFEMDREKEEEFYQWLGQNRRFYGVNGTNALWVWERIIMHVYKKGDFQA